MNGFISEYKHVAASIAYGLGGNKQSSNPYYMTCCTLINISSSYFHHAGLTVESKFLNLAAYKNSEDQNFVKNSCLCVFCIG